MRRLLTFPGWPTFAGVMLAAGAIAASAATALAHGPSAATPREVAGGTPPAAAGKASASLQLIEAAKAQSFERLQVWLSRGADVNATSADGATALHWAAHWNDAGAADTLLRAGARVNTRNELGATPLWVASVHGSPRVIERLLAAGADPNLALAGGETPLMAAARTGVADSVRLLIARGADVNAAEHARGQTALMWAAAQNHAAVIDLLVAGGARVEARSTVRPVVAWIGGGRSDVDTGKGLDPALFYTEQQGGYTPLLFAARNGAREAAKALLAHGANINAPAPTGASPLGVAAFSGHVDVALLLLDHGADANAADVGYSPLHLALIRRDQTLVKALLAHGADPNAVIRAPSPVNRGATDYKVNIAWVGATPFWLAASLREKDCMQMLAGNGAATRAATPDGSTALMAAVTSNTVARPGEVVDSHVDVLNLAVDLGADLDAVDAAGNTALHHAARLSREDVVQALVDRGAQLNVTNKKGQTPLALAAAAAKPDQTTLELLRQLGAKE